jgi:L-ascorbate metabolism protein UlaG (beta-lactamase superfamily)
MTNNLIVSGKMPGTTLAVTRVVNACVLLEMGSDAVLTDPYFHAHWFLRFREPIGLRVNQLPRLTAILGGHGVFDHWQPRSLAAYPFKRETPAYVATPSMERSAKAAGFEQAEVVAWNSKRVLSPNLTLEVVPAQRALGMKVNSYILATDTARVFVGTEACELEPLRCIRAQGKRIDVAILPIDGSSMAGRKLVMTAEDALEGARILGARTLVPIHYALKPVPLLLQTRSTLPQLLTLAHAASEVKVVPLETGQRWSWPN